MAPSEVKEDEATAKQEVVIAANPVKGLVDVSFRLPTSWLALPPLDAIQLACSLMVSATEVLQSQQPPK